MRPCVHHAHLVGHRERLLLIVRDKHRCRTAGLQNLTNLGAKPRAQVDIETRKRLIHQQQRRPRGQCTSECDALLLAAGEFVRIAAACAAKADQVDHAAHARRALGRPEMTQPECNVVFDSQMREQRVVLEYQADRRAFRSRQ